MPARSAAEIIISPCLASIVRPSTTISGMARTREGAAAVLDVDEELVAEHLQRRRNRRRDRRPEHADRGLGRGPAQAGGDVVADIEQQVEIALAALAQLDAAHHL